MFKKNLSVLAFLLLLVTAVGVFVNPDKAEAVSNNEQDCYSLILNKVASIPNGNEFLASISKNYSDLDGELLERESSISPVARIMFSKQVFSEKYYNFGDVFGLKISELFPINQILNVGNDSFKNDLIRKYSINFVYDKDDDQLISCSASLKDIKDGLPASSISKTDVLGLTASNLVGDVENIRMNGKDYKRIVTKKDVTNRNFSEVKYSDYVIQIFPKVNRKDFDPYRLVDAYVGFNKMYYEKVIPRITANVINKNFSKIRLYSDATDLTMELYVAEDIKNPESNRKLSVYGVEPVQLNGKIISEYTYCPWITPNIISKMLSLGLTDVTDVWLSYLNSDKESQKAFIKVTTGMSTMQQAGLTEDIKNNNIVNQIDNLVYFASGLSQTNGAFDPTETDEVKLFWRIKELITDGATTNDIKKYVEIYPEYLSSIAAHKADLIKTRASDIDQNAWYFSFVYKLMDQGVLSGYSDGTYKPSAFVNRAEIAKIAVILFDLPVENSIDSDPFSDVPKDAWFARYVAAAKKAGVIDGYSDGSFRPEKLVNRAEAIKIFTLASGVSMGMISTSVFTDVTDRAWYSPYVNFAGEKGVINGYSDGKFKPGDNINRAEIAKIASMAKKLLVK